MNKRMGRKKESSPEKIYFIISTQDGEMGFDRRYVVIVDGMEPSTIDKDDIPDGSKVYLLSSSDIAISVANRDMSKKKNKTSVALGITSFTSLIKKGSNKLNRIYASYDEDLIDNKKRLKIIPFASVFDGAMGGIKARQKRFKIGFYVGGDINRVYISIADKNSSHTNIIDKFADGADSARGEVRMYESADSTLDLGDFEEFLLTSDDLFEIIKKGEPFYPLKNEWMGVPFVYVGVASIVLSLSFLGIISAYKTIRVDELSSIKNEIHDIRNVKMQEIEEKRRDIYKSHIADYIKGMNINYQEILSVAEHVWTEGSIITLNADENTKRIVVTLPKDVSESDFERRKKIEKMIEKESVSGYSKQPLSSDSTISDVEAVYVKETIQ